jgi:putative membrane protein
MTQRRGFLDDPEPDIAVARPLPPPPPPPERGWLAGVDGAAGPVRHAAAATLPAKATREHRQPLAIAAGALVLLIGGVALLELANFAVAQFDKSPLLGWLTIALIGPPAAALGWSVVREWRGYASLRAVERIRAGLQSDDIEVARRHARTWLRAIAASDDLARSVEAASDPATLRALLRSGPLARLDQEAAQAGRSAALQILAATAVSPWPGLDGVLVIWRGLRLIRRIAELYGMRPGTLGTLRLWRRVALDAGSVAAADVVVATMTDALFSSPLGGALAGQASGSAIAAQRMLRLSVAVARSCRPIDEEA